MSNELNVVSIRLIKDKTLLSDKKINSPTDAVNIISKYMSDLDREVICIINLAGDNKPINCSFVSMGSINRSIVAPREIFKSSILSNASSIIMLHNHPSGSIKPSREDIEITNKIMVCSKLMDIPLVDHIIVGYDETFSFCEHRLLQEPDMSVFYKKEDTKDKFDVKNVAEEITRARRRR